MGLTGLEPVTSCLSNKITTRDNSAAAVFSIINPDSIADRFHIEPLLNYFVPQILHKNYPPAFVIHRQPARIHLARFLQRTHSASSSSEVMVRNRWINCLRSASSFNRSSAR